MARTNIYLHFDGNCEAAFCLYREVFQTEFTNILRYSDIPRQEGMPLVPERDLNKIENVGIKISDETLLMGSDGLECFGQKTIVGNNFSIYVEATSGEEADRIFSGLSEGGQVKMPMTIAHWGDYFGMLTDRFGINWLVNCSCDSISRVP